MTTASSESFARFSVDEIALYRALFGELPPLNREQWAEWRADRLRRRIEAGDIRRERASVKE